MSLFYNIVKRFNPAKPKEPPKYHAVIKSDGVVTISDIGKRITASSAFTRADVIGLMYGLMDVIADELKDGKIVRIDPLGTFTLKAKSRGTDDPKKFTSRRIDGVKLHFSPHKEFLDELRSVQWKKWKP